MVLKSSKEWLISVLPDDIEKYLKGFKSREEDSEPPPGNRTELAPRWREAHVIRIGPRDVPNRA